MWFYTGEFSNGYTYDENGNKRTEYVTADYDFLIDWGDGTAVEHYDNSMATTVFREYDGSGYYNDRKYIPVRHTYSKKGSYKVTITGTCDNLHGYHTGHSNATSRGAKMSKALVKSLWGIQVPADSTSPLKYGYGSFFGCENLKFVGYGVFHNITECREVPHLYDGAVISRIEPWMLHGGEKLQSVSYTFENCQMYEIDPDIFKNCPNIEDASHLFHRCNVLKEIPDSLFENNTKITNLSCAFKSCSNVTYVPSDLFDNCPDIIDASECFSGGRADSDGAYPTIMKINSALPPLWNREGSISHSYYAHGCSNATNYKDALLNGWVYR